jgi:hypothetical protein
VAGCKQMSTDRERFSDRMDRMDRILEGTGVDLKV